MAAMGLPFRRLFFPVSFIFSDLLQVAGAFFSFDHFVLIKNVLK